jgi:hypothetical protein
MEHTFLDSKLRSGDLLSLGACSSICVSILLLLLLLRGIVSIFPWQEAA